MRIVHIAPNSPYNEGWGYQENLLPKYHAKMGHKVVLITTTKTYHDGKVIETMPEDYLSKDGFRVIRCYYKKFYLFTKLFSKMDIYSLLIQLHPDFVFFHGLVSRTIFDVIKYKKKHNNNCIIVQDNHLDYNNFIDIRKKIPIKLRVKRLYYIYLNYRTHRHIKKVFGVTPWRKEYAERFFSISPQKTDVLIMGADDEKIVFHNRERIRSEIRDKYQIGKDDYLVVTGGKITEKKRIDVLMEACGEMGNVKLLVFGTVDVAIKDKFYSIIQKYKNIIYIGWVASDDVYNYFFAADLAFFPSQHSVLWEQACASKIPCVFKYYEGMTHVNSGGNAAFIFNDDIKEMKDMISKLFFTDEYFEMKKVAESNKTDIFLYSAIARKSFAFLTSNGLNT